MPHSRDVVFGAIAGLCATMAMTATMRRLWTALPDDDRYPLPPREITDTVLPAALSTDGSTRALLAHFAYGALTGAIYGGLPRPRPSGIIYGPAIWAASYLGWIPAAAVLKPAHRHPATRNALMLAAHVVWGAVLTVGFRELHRATHDGFDGGKMHDARSKTRGLHA